MKVRDHHETCHGDVPAHPEGLEWQHVMVLHDGSTVYADTATEVLAELLPGYQLLDADAQLSARCRHAHQVAAFVQRLYLERATRDDGFDQAANAALVEIMGTDKAVSLSLSLPHAPQQPADWLPSVPLVLVNTQYAPHQAYPPIGGNVIWIDPASEAGYLLSLRASGIFSYWTNREEHP